MYIRSSTKFLMNFARSPSAKAAELHSKCRLVNLRFQAELLPTSISLTGWLTRFLFSCFRCGADALAASFFVSYLVAYLTTQIC